MDKKRLLFCEHMRMMLAKDLDIPPDDIDMSTFIGCVERSIREKCEGKDDDVIISPKNQQEEEAILGEYGPEIIGKIFTHQFPFFEWESKYEKYYTSMLNHLKNPMWTLTDVDQDEYENLWRFD